MLKITDKQGKIKFIWEDDDEVPRPIVPQQQDEDDEEEEGEVEEGEVDATTV